MTDRDMNDRVAAYRDLVVSLVEALGYDQSNWRNGNALISRDDLIQEGMINVWQTLQRGITPSAKIITARMRDYIRWAKSRRNVPYEKANPLEDYSEILSRSAVSG